MEEVRIFLELLKMPDGRVSFVVGGGTINDGQMEEHYDLASSIKDLEERAVIDYKRLKG